MIKAIIFDLAGVCFTDYGTGNIDNKKKYAKLVGLPTEEFGKIWESIWFQYKRGMITEKEFWKVLIEKSNSRVKIEDLMNALRKEIKPKRDVIEIVKKLRKNYTVVMITNNTKEWVDYINRKFGLNKIFELIVNSADVCMVKPDPEIYEFTLKKLNLKPEECVFIDDLERNLKSANDLGMKTILFESTEELKSKLNKLGVKVDG